MKVIPKKEIIMLLEKKVEGELLTRCVFDELFELYGDDWFISDTDHTKYTLCKVNIERERVIKSE